jgi:hypothetical protein
VWAGSELKEAGSATFDIGEVPLQHGDAAPLLCLSAVETDYATKMCVPEIDCSGFGYFHRTHQLDAALLEVVTEPPPLAQSQSPSPAGDEPCKKPRKRLKRPQKYDGLSLGPSVRVKGKAKPVRRCKTG